MHIHTCLDTSINHSFNSAVVGIHIISFYIQCFWRAKNKENAWIDIGRNEYIMESWQFKLNTLVIVQSYLNQQHNSGMKNGILPHHLVFNNPIKFWSNVLVGLGGVVGFYCLHTKTVDASLNRCIKMPRDNNKNQNTHIHLVHNTKHFWKIGY